MTTTKNMTKYPPRTEAEWTTRLAVRNANSWFENCIKQFERQAEEMMRYHERFKTAAANGDQSATTSDVLSWAVMHAAQGTGNLRLDLAVTRAADLERGRMLGCSIVEDAQPEDHSEAKAIKTPTVQWHVVTDEDEVAMTADSVAEQANLQRTSPRLFAVKYARDNSGPLEGESLRAEPAQ